MARLVLIKHKEFDNTLATACLIRYCKQDPIQAEQCAYITYTKGEYAIKEDSLEELTEISEVLNELGFETKVIID